MQSLALFVMNKVPARIAQGFSGGSSAARVLRPIVNRIVSNEAVQVTVRSGPGAGLLIEIDPSAEKYYWTGTYEAQVQEAIVQLLKPGAVMWDVGAHSGFHTALASRIVGRVGQVVAFEPLLTNLARLRRTIELNGLQNVVVRPLAVSESSGVATFHVAASSSMGSLVALGNSAATFEVGTTTLDSELASLRAPAVVKLDIEGAEMAAFRGASELLSRIRPVLIVEFLTTERLGEAATALPTYQFRALDQRNYIGEPVGE